MRLIEKQMIAAIAAGKDWNGGNTIVSIHSDGVGGTLPNVFLHGNHIATMHADKCVVNVGTLRKWPTPTTKSRLNALGANVRTRKGVVYLNGVAL